MLNYFSTFIVNGFYIVSERGFEVHKDCEVDEDDIIFDSNYILDLIAKKKDEKDTLVSFGIGDFGDEIGMLTEISTLQDIELFCIKRRLKIKKKLDKFREKRKNDR